MKVNSNTILINPAEENISIRVRATCLVGVDCEHEVIAVISPRMALTNARRLIEAVQEVQDAAAAAQLTHPWGPA